MTEAPKPQAKFIKNPNRGKPTPFKPYVPQWKERGLEPTDGFSDRPVSQATPQRLPFAAQVLRKTPEILPKQPYAEPGPTPQSSIGSLNVGSDNDWFQDFSVVEGPQSTIDAEQEMIDNNEYYTGSYAVSSTLPLKPKPINLQVEYTGKPIHLPVEEDTRPEESETEVVSIVPSFNIEPGQCLLMLDGQPVSIGDKEEIEAEVSSLIFGEHPLFQDQAISADQITVLKRIPVKVGVFLE